MSAQAVCLRGGRVVLYLTDMQIDPWYRRIIHLWWPLAASWLLMSIEGPAISATISRLANPEINLAAYGGVVFPLSLIIEAPIIMLLSASTALCKDWPSYRKVFNFMAVTAAALTGLHVLVAFTPLYDFVVSGLLGVPQETVEPARIGLQLMTPWTASIAYRRFQQGVMIRFGHSRGVSAGTAVRLMGLGSGLLLGSAMGWPGIVVGTLAQSIGVIAEAVFAGLRVRPILRGALRYAKPGEPLTWKAFFAFYVPLALTSLMMLAWNPIGSAALSRMPRPLESLAVFPVVTGLLFLLRSAGNALNETVVALLDEPQSYRPMRRFAAFMVVTMTLLHLLVAATPLSAFWFGRVTALRPELVEMARIGFWIALPIPGLTVLQSWFQGAIMHGRRTRGIPESIVAFLLAVLTVAGIGVNLAEITGLYVGMLAFTAANIAQTFWLWVRSRPIMREVRERDSAAREISVTIE